MRSSMRLEGMFLRGRLGRRILLMFCIAVIIPATAVFWLTYRTAARNAQQSSQVTMRAESKHFGMTVLERLQAARAMLDHAVARSGSAADNRALLEPFFTETAWVDARRPGETNQKGLAGTLARQSPGALASTQLLVLPPVDNHARPRIVLLSRPQGTPDGSILAGSLRPSFLWGRAEDLAIDGQLCIRAGKQVLSCVGDAPLHAHAGDLMHDEWELFLKPQFATGSWTIAATKQNPPALAGHLRVLAPVAVGLLLLVLLLSSIQIRRILVPLELLMARIRAVSQSPVPLAAAKTDDELATLSTTFGEMEKRIRRQMETLRTLAEVDRLILERVPVSLVIDVVVARIQIVANVGVAGVTVSTVGAPDDREHYIRVRGRRKVEAGMHATLAPLPADAYRSADTDKWKTMVVPGPGLEAHGATSVTYLALADRDRTPIWVALGHVSGEFPSEEVLAEVRELAERIAVARAVEAHESLLVFQARHDPLTGLPNRLAAIEALTLAIEHARTPDREFAAVFIDIDRFKSINDGLGHTLGDRVLMQVGERIRQSVCSDDFVSRFGGDEFFVILRGIRDTNGAARAAAKIKAAFASPITGEEIDLVVGFSVGIALHPQHGRDALELIHNSDVAMYRGKKAGGGRIEFFEEEMNAAALTRVKLENDLRVAIRGGQLELHYQPRVDSRNGSIVGAEALARWTHPIMGNIPPGVFVTLAEECGLIEELGKFVIDEACRQLGSWQRQGLDLPLVAVNISSHQLRSGRLVDVVTNAVTVSGIDWGQLEIEVTESLLVNDSGAAAQQLQLIRDAGSSVAIDDFGTGYSSLAYLTKLPTDTLKIDRSFFADLVDDGASILVIRSIIALAKALDKKIIAEGVETMALVDRLNAWGCFVIQGYVYYRPLTAEAMALELARAPNLRALVLS